ncbi:efflux RND transporter periplasmic adaptor subunit [Idiomarina sp. HP20-50]|uniref:efflux RND transporter periplasmic adaptor subunit n=1 Tax=Idiomarina sp. HP20-50 TaxID=3070813 RepID=UPI00294AB308|nr:efflux RND transporter periplasmic adaptor subunit [Idiomarina sp. HP20-50]MDV6315108.1 efflux RND transporter periplasmic adaptor subunit [Idiomarina sp. HP20-50]
MMALWFKRAIAFTALLVTSVAVVAQTPVEYVESKQRSVVNKISVPTTLAALNQSQLNFAVEGKLRKLKKDIGETVHKGDVLAELDSRQINSTIESLKAQVDSAKANLEDEKQQLSELEVLGKTDFVPASELRRSRTRVQVAKAQLAEAKAILNEMKVSQSYHQLTAPFDGVITDRTADLGEWLSAGQSVFQLVGSNNRYADAFLSEFLYLSLRSETKTTLSYQGTDINANIENIVPFVDGNDRSFRVRLTGEYPDNWVVGIPLKASFEIDSGRHQVSVPQDAVVRYSDGRTSVWVAQQNNGNWQALERPVELGLRFNGYVEIKSGLSPDERVIVRGNEALTDGQALELTESADYD